MPPSIKDWRGQGAREQVSERSRTLKQIQAAAVEAAKLTGDSKWDFFLRRIQAIINQLQAGVKELKEVIPGIFDERELRRLQLMHATMAGQLHAMEQVINMPKEIMEEGGMIDQFMSGKFELDDDSEEARIVEGNA